MCFLVSGMSIIGRLAVGLQVILRTTLPSAIFMYDKSALMISLKSDGLNKGETYESRWHI
jgi:hypothetical protein